MNSKQEAKKLNLAFTSCWNVKTTGVCFMKIKQGTYAGYNEKELVDERYIFNGIDFSKKS